MTQQSEPVYSAAQANLAADAGAYRAEVTGADDSLDLSAPLPVDTTGPSLNKGIQPTRSKQTILVSIVFDDPGDSVDAHLVTWAKKADGSLEALCVQNALTVVPGPFLDGGVEPMAEAKFFDATGAAAYEVRFRNITGTLKLVRTWAY